MKASVQQNLTGQWNEELEKKIIDRWYQDIIMNYDCTNIEAVLAFRIMLINGYNSLKDMLETLRIVRTCSIYEYSFMSKTCSINGILKQTNFFMIDEKYYYICR